MQEIIPLRYDTFFYPGPLPEDDNITPRLEKFQTLSNLGFLIGAGIFLSSLATAPSWLALGVASVCFLTRYQLGTIEDAITFKVKEHKFEMGTRLTAAARKGNWIMVKILLFFGANPNHTHNRNHPPALHQAIYGCARPNSDIQISIIKNLLHAGADVHHFEVGKYRAPLSEALDIHYSLSANEAAKLLLKWRANPNVEARPYERALFKAALNGKKDVVEELIKAGADLENKERCGQFQNETALFAAIHHVHLETVKLLLDKGAKKDAKNDKQKTPLQIAEEMKKEIENKTPGARGLIGYDPGTNSKFDTRAKDEILKTLDEIIELLK